MVSTAFPDTQTTAPVTPAPDAAPPFDPASVADPFTPTAAESDAPAEASAPPPDPFASLPDDHPLKQQLRTAEERAAAAEALAASVKSKTDAWDQQIQQAQQTELVQRQQAALDAWQQKLAEGTLEPQEIAQTRELLARGLEHSSLIPAGNGVFFKSRDTIRQYHEFDAAATLNDLRNHAWDTLLDAFPPQTSLATLRARHKELLAELPQGLQSADQRVPLLKQWMVRQAKGLAGAQYEQNRRTNVESGAERVEASGARVGGRSEYDRYVEALRSGGPMPFTPAEIDRIVTARYRGG